LTRRVSSLSTCWKLAKKAQQFGDGATSPVVKLAPVLEPAAVPTTKHPPYYPDSGQLPFRIPGLLIFTQNCVTEGVSLAEILNQMSTIKP
jgi:hypothetical protein